MAFILVNSTLNIMDYDAVKNSSLSPQSEDDKVNLSISQRESENIARQMIDIFKRGFSQ
jgi:hypothetical protein